MRNQLKTFGRRILTARGGLIAGLAVVLLGNAAVVARVAYNRTGEPEVWTFSEREFSRSWRYYHRRNRENSGMALHLDWRPPPPDELDPSRYSYNSRTLRVTPGQLDALGYPADLECPAPSDRRPDRGGRRVWAALEFDGPAHRRHVALLEEHLNEQIREAGAPPSEEAQQRIDRIQTELDELRNHDSRLYVVDFALGRMNLERRYRTDDARHLILPAVVSPHYHCKQQTRLYIKDVFNTDIYVPKPHRAAFSHIAERRDRNSRPTFEVKVAYGRLQEPWLKDIRVVERQEK